MQVVVCLIMKRLMKFSISYLIQDGGINRVRVLLCLCEKTDQIDFSICSKKTAPLVGRIGLSDLSLIIFTKHAPRKII